MERTSPSFKVSISTAGGEQIATIDEGITFLPRRGEATATGVANNPIVKEETSINFALTPEHLIYSRDNPTIMITLPTQIGMGAADCVVENVQIHEDDGPNDVDPLCEKSQSGRIMTISNWLIKDYDPAEGFPITLTVGNVINPGSTEPVEGLYISILGEGLYPIDDFYGDTPWALEPATFS
jgi:hypothetical protein